MYDTRVCRFISVDPITKKYPELTPYQFASNRPIDGIDLDGKEHFYSADGVLIGKVGASTEIRVIDESKISMDQTKSYITFANNNNVTSGDAASYTNKYSQSLNSYAQNVPDVLNNAPLETWSGNGYNCYTAAGQQMADAKQGFEGKYSSIQTDVDNSLQSASEKLTENEAGGLIYTMTELKKGHPVMVGVKETNTDGSIERVGNYNKNTGHFIVVSSMTKTSKGFSLGFYDNANIVTGKSKDNQLKVNTSNGAMTDDNNCPVGGVQSYKVSEVEKNK
jgi:hypothetical protein